MYLQVCSFTKINLILDFLLRIFETFAIHYSKYLHLCWRTKLNERLHELRREAKNMEMTFLDWVVLNMKHVPEKNFKNRTVYLVH